MKSLRIFYLLAIILLFQDSSLFTQATDEEEGINDDECHSEVTLTTSQQKYLYKKWETAWEDMDTNGTDSITWHEYWAWVKGCLEQQGFSEFTIRKYKSKFYK